MNAAPALQAHRYAITSRGVVEVPVEDAAQGLHAVLSLLPEGVYSGLRSFAGGRFLALEEHLARAERSARALGFELGDERADLVRGLQQIVDEAASQSLKLRFDILPGPFELASVSARLWVSAVAFTPVPRACLEQGVRVEVAAGLVREQPLVKTTEFVLRRVPYPLETPQAYEHLLVDEHDRILECSSANFYCVRGDRLVTAGSGVLEGITRGIVLRLAQADGLALELVAPQLSEVGAWSEAMLSSSTRGIVPVVNLCGAPVGTGRPGPRTRALMQAYDEFAEREARRALPARAAH